MIHCTISFVSHLTFLAHFTFLDNVGLKNRKIVYQSDFYIDGVEAKLALAYLSSRNRNKEKLEMER